MLNVDVYGIEYFILEDYLLSPFMSYLPAFVTIFSLSSRSSPKHCLQEHPSNSAAKPKESSIITEEADFFKYHGNPGHSEDPF